LRGYLEPLLSRDLSHVKNIRLGTKSLTYWPHRYLAGADAQELLDLIEQLVNGGKHVAIMAHINHWREMAPAPFQEAVHRLRQAGAVIRTQSPLLRHINDAPDVWRKTWTEQVRQGMVPYYMFIERDTGPSRYFGLPLFRALHIFNEASAGISGICKTARGPVMSAGPGKIQIVGTIEVYGRKHFVLTFLQARDSTWLGRPFLAKYSETAQWLDHLVPADEGSSFFYEKGYAELLNQKRVSTASVENTYAHTHF
jgi:L-lysine 2,3-aminomutase